MTTEERATAYVLRARSPGEGDEVARERLYNAELDEHILIIAGDLDIGGHRFGTGDYIRVPVGTVHERMTTDGGGLLFTEYRQPEVGRPPISRMPARSIEAFQPIPGQTLE